jgi:outer membrane protein W
MQREIRNDGREATMRTKCVLSLLVMLSVLGLASQASASLLGSYLALKGGSYSQSASFDLNNADIETTFDGNTKTGFNGEVAIGHYFLPTVAMELGVGYFKGKGSFAPTSPTSSRAQMHFNVIPVVVTAKALIPIGAVNPYGELGIGAYTTSFKVNDNLNTFSGSTTFGLHAGVGMNVNITPHAFLGVEGRYVNANPSFGNQKIRLNNTDYALNGFKLNGFTTTLALGFSF